jgi:hypothetical protein
MCEDLALFCLGKAEVYPVVRRAFSQTEEGKKFAQIAAENRSS